MTVVGSWKFIDTGADASADGNVMIGDHVAVDSTACTVVSKVRLVALLGVDNLVVVEGGDTIMVCDRRRAQDVKKIVGTLRDRGRTELL